MSMQWEHEPVIMKSRRVECGWMRQENCLKGTFLRFMEHAKSLFRSLLMIVNEFQEIMGIDEFSFRP